MGAKKNRISFSSAFGEAVYKFRRANKLSGREFGKIIGVSGNTVFYIEHGHRKITEAEYKKAMDNGIDLASELATIAGVSEDKLQLERIKEPSEATKETDTDTLKKETSNLSEGKEMSLEEFANMQREEEYQNACAGEEPVDIEKDFADDIIECAEIREFKSQIKTLEEENKRLKENGSYLKLDDLKDRYIIALETLAGLRI